MGRIINFVALTCTVCFSNLNNYISDCLTYNSIKVHYFFDNKLSPNQVFFCT